MKPQRKDAGGRKSEQHSNNPQPKPSSLQSAVGCAHQDSDSTATSERARTDHQPSPNTRLRGTSHHHTILGTKHYYWNAPKGNSGGLRLPMPS